MSATAPPFSLDASAAYLRRAEASLARGVGSAARARTLSPAPVLVAAEGARVRDLDGNEYVDLVMGLGPLLLGHRPAPVVEAVRAALDDGSVLCGGPHPREAELAELVCETVPCAERVVYASTGSEGVHAAIRIARATTGRRLVVKFDGQYHGWIDPVFVNALGTPPEHGAAPLPLTPNVDGAPAPDDVILCPWNDADALDALMARLGPQVACVLMEPVPCNFGTFRPDDGYLEAVRETCDRHGALLVFDEVVTGFRLALGGAQELFGVTPDLAVLAKAIASGFGLAMVAGTAAAMSSATAGPVRQGGTYNASGPGVAAAIATIRHLQGAGPELYAGLDRRGAALAAGLEAAGREHGLPLVAMQVGSVVQLLWNPRRPVRSYADARADDQAPVAAIADALLQRGVLVPERGLCFLSTAHGDADVAQVVAAVREAAAELAVAR